MSGFILYVVPFEAIWTERILGGREGVLSLRQDVKSSKAGCVCGWTVMSRSRLDSARHGSTVSTERVTLFRCARRLARERSIVVCARKATANAMEPYKGMFKGLGRSILGLFELIYYPCARSYAE